MVNAGDAMTTGGTAAVEVGHGVHLAGGGQDRACRHRCTDAAAYGRAAEPVTIGRLRRRARSGTVSLNRPAPETAAVATATQIDWTVIEPFDRTSEDLLHLRPDLPHDRRSTSRGRPLIGRPAHPVGLLTDREADPRLGGR